MLLVIFNVSKVLKVLKLLVVINREDVFSKTVGFRRKLLFSSFSFTFSKLNSAIILGAELPKGFNFQKKLLIQGKTKRFVQEIRGL